MSRRAKEGSRTGRELSPAQVAQALGVSESSVKRWVDSGVLESRKTTGGHRRLAVDTVLRFLRDHNSTLAHPEMLGLPSKALRLSARGDDEQAIDGLVEALRGSDEATARALILGAFLADRAIAAIFDDLVAPAFHRIGDMWAAGSLEIYQEHLAVEIVLRVLHELLGLLPKHSGTAPLAVGATLEGDPYMLSVEMAALTLCDRGWRARSLGVSHPAHTLRAALRDLKPKLFFINVSHVGDESRLLCDFNQFYDFAKSFDVALVVGGQALTTELRRQLRYTAFCETMAELAELSEALLGAKKSTVSNAG